VVSVTTAGSFAGMMFAPALFGAIRQLADWALLGSFTAGCAAYGAIVVPHKRALRRRAFAAQFTLCTGCAYDISSLERTSDEPGRDVRCPECGTLVCAKDARVLWHEYLMK
jgi:hypothetical protein